MFSFSVQKGMVLFGNLDLFLKSFAYIRVGMLLLMKVVIVEIWKEKKSN